AGGDVFEQFVGEPGPVQADQHPTPIAARDAGHRLVEQGDVVRGVVGGGVARTGVDHEQVVGVVAGGHVRAEPDAALVGGSGVFLVRAGVNDRGVQVDHGDPGHLAAAAP